MIKEAGATQSFFVYAGAHNLPPLGCYVYFMYFYLWLFFLGVERGLGDRSLSFHCVLCAVCITSCAPDCRWSLWVESCRWAFRELNESGGVVLEGGSVSGVLGVARGSERRISKRFTHDVVVFMWFVFWILHPAAHLIPCARCKYLGDILERGW